MIGPRKLITGLVLITIIVLSILDLLVANSESFRAKTQNLIWNPKPEIKSFLDDIFGKDGYLVYDPEDVNGENYFIEIKTIFFWFNFHKTSFSVLDLGKVKDDDSGLIFINSEDYDEIYLKIIKEKGIIIDNFCFANEPIERVRLPGVESEFYFIFQREYVLMDIPVKFKDKILMSECF